MNQKSPKDPKSILILTMKLSTVHILLEDAAYRCFDLAHTDLAHLSPNRATHLKSPEKSFAPGLRGGPFLENLSLLNTARGQEDNAGFSCTQILTTETLEPGGGGGANSLGGGSQQ